MTLKRGRNLSPKQKQIKWSVAEIPSWEKAKISGHAAVCPDYNRSVICPCLGRGCGWSLKCHRQYAFHNWISDSLIHEIWRSGKVKTYQNNQACLSRLQLEHHCCTCWEGGVWPPWKCPVHFAFEWGIKLCSSGYQLQLIVYCNT